MTAISLPRPRRAGPLAVLAASVALIVNRLRDNRRQSA